MAQTLTGTIGTLVSLTAAAHDPTTVAVSGYLTAGLKGDTSRAWRVVNLGTISQAAGNGIFLTKGGTVTNSGTASKITASSSAVRIDSAAGTVVNAGLIAGSGRGIDLRAGGVVTNQASGTIRGSGGVVSEAKATITNAGLIEGGTGTGTGIDIRAGGVVTNQAGGTIRGRDGVASNVTATITNAGLIAAGTAVFGQGIKLGGGVVTNQASGTISGDFGAYFTGAGTITNAGLIAGGTASGVGFYSGVGGVVTNQAGGTIRGLFGVASRTTATITNAGLIGGGTASDNGIVLFAGGGVTNQAAGTISGTQAVTIFGAAGTVRNAGTITGSATAVAFAAGYAHSLTVDAGAVFSGTVTGGNTIGSTIASTMVLASAASTGTISGLGSQFIRFARTTIEAGANWALTGTNTLANNTTLTNAGTLGLNAGALTVDDLLGGGRVVVTGNGTLTTTGTVAATQTIELGGGLNRLALDHTGFAATIAGFGTGETIALAGVTDAVSAAITNANTLVIDRSDNPDISLILDPGTSYAGATFTIGDAASDFITTDLACFVAGTRIETPGGPVAVESLRVGALVLTASGAPAPVRWIGYRRLDVTRHPDPTLVRPIRIAPDALAPGVPSRDVLLSPDHALALSGFLVPVHRLVNGMTIHEDASRAMVAYYHIELDRHDLLLSEGLAVESYLDTGNRAMFENGGAPLVLHPDPGAGQAERVARSCLPFADRGEDVRPIWGALASRARGLGYVAEDVMTSEDPALMLAVDGRMIPAASIRGGVHTFVLPVFRGRPRLVSRAVRPSLARPWDGDRRRLGVMVRRITLRGSRQTMDLPLDHPGLRDGWWTLERDRISVWRWTDGNAALPLDGGGAGVLEVRVGPSLAYAVAA